MEAPALAVRLRGIEGRSAGSDAERRAALLCARELRAAGRRPRMRTLWFWPQRWLPRALYAALGVAGSVTAESTPVAGLALAGGALLATLVESAGLPLAGRLSTRRATQNVVAPPIDPGPRVLLILTASVDAPPDGVATRLRSALTERLHGGRSAAIVPGPAGTLALVLAAIAACAGARVAGAEGVALGAVQLVPTAMAILLIGAFIDAAVARPAPDAPCAGAAVALAATAKLDAAPPRHLAVEVVLAGAGEAGAAGLRSHVAERRRERDAEDVVLLHLAGEDGPVRFLVRDGELFGVRLHPRLAELARELAGEGAQAEGRGVSGARVARAAHWPALALSGEPARLEPLVLELVAAIDREVAGRGRAQ